MNNFHIHDFISPHSNPMREAFYPQCAGDKIEAVQLCELNEPAGAAPPDVSD